MDRKKLVSLFFVISCGSVDTTAVSESGGESGDSTATSADDSTSSTHDTTATDTSSESSSGLTDTGASDSSGSDGSTDGETEGTPTGPRCLPDADPLPPPDPRAPQGAASPALDLPGYILEGCPSLMTGPSGIDDLTASATLTVGADTFALTRAAFGPLETDDDVPEHESVYSGFHITLTPADACRPMIQIYVVDDSAYSGDPVDFPVTDLVCGGLHNVTVNLITEDGCWTPTPVVPGTLHIDELGTPYVAGSLHTTLTDASAPMTPVDVELDFAVTDGDVFGLIGPHLAGDICSY